MKVWVDPPSGWRYGFPKLCDNIENLDEFLVENGYPREQLAFAMRWMRMWEEDSDDYDDDSHDYSDESQNYLDLEMDGDHDSSMRSAGWGTDEDYGYYGDE